jgi:hypothetical protein
LYREASTRPAIEKAVGPGPSAALDESRRERLVRLLAAATFLIFFQACMVAPLIPRLSEVFGVPAQAVGLIVPAYLIPDGVATLVYGVLSDRLGRRRIMQASPRSRSSAPRPRLGDRDPDGASLSLEATPPTTQRRTHHMRRRLIAVVSAVLAPFAAVSIVLAQQQIEGTVVSTTMTACDMKPGTCEGTMVLDTKGATPGQVTIKVQKGTVIKHGDGHLFLPGTKGRVVAIAYVENKGEKVAKSIEVKSAKP